jgi:hypothetical protein
VRGPELIVDGRPLPTLPVHHRALVNLVELTALTIKENENVIFEDREQVAEFLASHTDRRAAVP